MHIRRLPAIPTGMLTGAAVPHLVSDGEYGRQ